MIYPRSHIADIADIIIIIITDSYSGPDLYYAVLCPTLIIVVPILQMRKLRFNRRSSAKVTVDFLTQVYLALFPTLSPCYLLQDIP